MSEIIKICTCCNTPKEISEFHKGKGKYGVRSNCKICVYHINLKYHPLKVNTNKPGEKTCTCCDTTKDLSEFYKTKTGTKAICKTCEIKIVTKYKQDNKEKIQEYNKTPEIKAYKKQWLLDNPDYKRQYNIDNKDRINKLHSDRSKQRRKEDPHYKMRCDIRTLIRTSVTNEYTVKSKKTTAILGCSFEEFKIHIENQFDEHMNWDNHGSYWSYDHIKPISLATNAQETYKLNHYTNFQPLEKIANIKKGNKYTEPILCNI